VKGVKKDLELNTSTIVWGGEYPSVRLCSVQVQHAAQRPPPHTFLKAFSVLVSLLCSVYRVTPETVSTSTYVTEEGLSFFQNVLTGPVKTKGLVNLPDFLPN
jgi:hypothetical protein